MGFDLWSGEIPRVAICVPQTPEARIQEPGQPAQGAATMRSLHVTVKSSPRSLQLEEALA